MKKIDYEEYYKIVAPILSNKEFDKRKEYKHHGEETVYEHSIKVSIKSYKLAKILKLDKESVAIGALLHDFYNEPWQEKKKEKFFKSHGFVHAKEALDNASYHFPQLLNKKVNDIIEKHMFPLNIKPPKYLESWIVSFYDKYISLSIFKNPKQLPKYLGITRRKRIIFLKRR